MYIECSVSALEKIYRTLCLIGKKHRYYFSARKQEPTLVLSMPPLSEPVPSGAAEEGTGAA